MPPIKIVNKLVNTVSNIFLYLVQKLWKIMFNSLIK